MRHKYWAFAPTAPIIMYLFLLLLKWISIKGYLKVYSFIKWFVILLLIYNVGFRIYSGIYRVFFIETIKIKDSKSILDGIRIPTQDTAFYSEIKRIPSGSKIVLNCKRQQFLMPYLLNYPQNVVEKDAFVDYGYYLTHKNQFDSTKNQFRVCGYGSELIRLIYQKK